MIKCGSSGNLTINLSGSDLIDGLSTSIVLDVYEILKIKSVAAGNWVKIDKTDKTGAEKIDDLSDGKTGGGPGYSVYLGNLSGIGASGTGNVALGNGTLLTATGDNNVALGNTAGTTVTSGTLNVLVGESAGSSVITGASNIMIGADTEPTSASASNELNIGDALYATGLNGSSANVGIGNTNNAPNSTLDVKGSFSLSIKSLSTAYTLTDSDYTYLVNNSTTNGADITLPSAIGRKGRIYIIKNIGSATQTLYPAPLTGETIDNSASIDLTIFGVLLPTFIIQSDGANWWVLSRF